jgi:L-iditol 2-dehydrogenase
VLGHEVAGRVVEVGENVRGFKSGDRVVVEPQRACGKCELCRRGKYHLCSNKEVPGKGRWVGSFAEFFIVPAASAYLLPAGISWAIGALVEPLAVGQHAIAVGEVVPGESAAVIGAGPIGLAVLLALANAGIDRVAAVDTAPHKLDIARRFGAAPVAASYGVEGIVKAIGGEADVVFVTASYPAVIGDALRCAGPAGRAVVLSLFDEPVAFDPGRLVFGERRLIGSLTYQRTDFEAVIAGLIRDPSRAEAMISHVLPLHSAGQALEMLDRGTDGAVKIILTHNDA